MTTELTTAPFRETPTPRRGFGARLADALLTVTAVGGSLCIVLVICAVVFNITLIMFKTGSMSPTIPAGSVAVVKEIAASEVSVGDVVTVDRPDQLPVTHRVVTVKAGADGETVLTLKGDANQVADPYPYTVRTVRVVLFSIPGIAGFLAGASNPLALGLITLAVAALVTWAFWPRPSRIPGHGPEPDPERDPEREGEGGPGHGRGRHRTT